MAIKRRAAGQFVPRGDVPWVAPAEEVVFDLLAAGVVADGAFAGVASEVG